MIKPKIKCKDCFCYYTYDSDSELGQCRRYPPKLFQEKRITDDEYGDKETNFFYDERFPEVHVNDFCLEFTSKNEKEEH